MVCWCVCGAGDWLEHVAVAGYLVGDEHLDRYPWASVRPVT